MRSAALISAIMLLAACSLGVSAPKDEIELRTGRSLYAPWDTVTVSISNRLSETVYISHCNHRVTLILEKRTGDTWSHHHQVNGPLCLTVYPMGETAIVRGTPLTERFKLEETGQFRLRLGARRASEDFGSMAIYSPPFTVAFPPD